MTDQNTLLAYLSAYSYRAGYDESVWITRPPVVEPIDSIIEPDAGLEAYAFRYSGPNGQVIVSFADTNPDDWLGDAYTDVQLALGNRAKQLRFAARFHEQIMTDHGSNIIFTDRSLGGGLAARVRAT